MAHTRPPWSSKWRMATIFEQIDSGELAARLGSIVTFDRRGNVIGMDDFEGSTLKWEAFTTGAGGSVSLNDTYARNGDQSCKMVPGSGDGMTAYMYKYIPLPRESHVGVECSFTRHADIGDILFHLSFYDGTYLKKCGLGCSFENDKLYYYPQTEIWTEFHDGWVPKTSNYLFSTAKLVIDYSTTDYIRALVNEAEYDLSAYDYYSTGDPTSPYMLLSVTVTNTKAGNPAIYIDDVIITQNEP